MLPRTCRTLAILAELPSLSWLCLSLCAGITDEGLRLLAGGEPGAGQGTGAGEGAQGQGGAGARALAWLDVSHCFRLSRRAVAELEARRPQLKVVATGRR